MANPSLISATGTSILGVFDHVVITVFRERVLAADIERLHETCTDLAKTLGGGIGVLDIVEPSTKPPDESGRAAFAAFVKDTSITAVAVVPEGQGFLASLVRSVTAGVALMARPVFPIHICSDVEAGTQWLSPRLEARRVLYASTPSVLSEAVGRLRRMAEREWTDPRLSRSIHA